MSEQMAGLQESTISFPFTWDAPRLIRALRNRRFKFHKSTQLFIRSHNETQTVVAMRVEIDKGVLVVAHGTLWQ
jgi:hypothetical protein